MVRGRVDSGYRIKSEFGRTGRSQSDKAEWCKEAPSEGVVSNIILSGHEVKIE